MKNTLLKMSLSVLLFIPTVSLGQTPRLTEAQKKQEAHSKCIEGLAEQWKGGDEYQLSQNGKGEVVTANLGPGTMVWNNGGSTLVDGKRCTYNKQTVNDLLASWITESSRRPENLKVTGYESWLKACAGEANSTISDAAHEALDNLHSVSTAPPTNPANTVR
jgi:hypothetical protein